MKPAQTVSALLVAVSLGCGGESPTRPTRGRPPTLEFATLSSAPCGLVTPTVYFVSGLSSHVRDAEVTPLDAVLSPGETVRLSLDFEGCHVGSFRSLVWTSTDASIAALTEDSRYEFVAELTARTPGETTIFVEFEAYDGGTYRTYAAYCPRSQYGCLAPRRPIARVRVVAPPPGS